MNFDELFQDLETRLANYGTGQGVSFFWTFHTPEERDAFQADPRFKYLAQTCQAMQVVLAVESGPPDRVDARRYSCSSRKPPPVSGRRIRKSVRAEISVRDRVHSRISLSEWIGRKTIRLDNTDYCTDVDMVTG